MLTIGGKARQQVVLLLACCALLLRHSQSLRDLPSVHAAQRRLYAFKASGTSLRGLRAEFEDDYDEDEELNTHVKLGEGISRLGIHGEGLGHVSHNLMESDSEVMALAAALSSGGATAEGGGLDSTRSLHNNGKPSPEVLSFWKSCQHSHQAVEAEQRAQSTSLTLYIKS